MASRTANIGPVTIAGHSQHFDPAKAQIAEHVVVAGVIDHRDVAGLQQASDDKFERLTRSIRQQDLVGLRGDSEAGQHQCEMLTQRQIAERMAIFEQMGSVLTDERVEALANAGLVEPGIWQPWAAGEGSVLVSLQKLTNQPQELLVSLVALERGRNRVERRQGCHVEPSARTGLKIAHCDQTVIGLDHCEAADVERFRQVADRRQSRTRSEASIINLQLHAADDLVDQRPFTRGAND